MKRILYAVAMLTAVIAVPITGLAILAHFQPIQPADAASFSPPYVQYESTIADGGAVASPVLSFTSCDDVEILSNNKLGTGAARTLTADWIGDDGTTIDYERVVNVDAGQYTAINISRFASGAPAASYGGYETIIPQMPGSKMAFTLSAAPGATTGTMKVVCR